MDPQRTPDNKDRCFVMVQEGGASGELYLRVWSTQEEADQDRINCARGAYRTSPAIAIPDSLAGYPDFCDAVGGILALVGELEYGDDEEDMSEE